MYLKSFFYLFILVSVFFFKRSDAYSQNKLSIEPGVYVNSMFFLSDYPTGLGLKFDVNFTPFERSFVTFALRGKYAYYNFNDNSSITYNSEGMMNSYNKNPDLLYTISLPQISFVPKLVYKVDNDISLFFENDFSLGHIYGNIQYIDGKRIIKKKVNEPKFIYSPSVGIGFKANGFRVVTSVGYTFLNFRDIIKRNRPINYDKPISTQDTGILMSASIVIPVLK